MKKLVAAIVVLFVALSVFLVPDEEEVSIPPVTNGTVERTPIMPNSVVRGTEESALATDEFIAAFDEILPPTEVPVSKRKIEEALLDVRPVEIAEISYEEYWKPFVDSLELTNAERGRVKDILMIAEAHNFEIAEMHANSELNGEEASSSRVTEEDVADALKYVLSEDQIQGYWDTIETNNQAFLERVRQRRSERLSNGEVGILDASGRNDTETVKAFIDSGANVNMMSLDGSTTPLLDAVAKNNVEMTQMLVDAGADVNLPSQDEFEITPVKWAAMHGSDEVIRVLVEAGADVDYAPKGSTPLEAASYGGYTDAVAELLRSGADVSGFSGSMALANAIQYNDHDMEQMLIDAGAVENSTVETARYAQERREAVNVVQ